MSDRVREQIELLREELVDVDAQVRDGDLDEETAAGIKARYEAELAALEASLAAAITADANDDQAGDDVSGRKRLNGRAITGIALVAVAMTVIGVFAVQSINNQRITGADGIVGDIVRGEAQINLDDVSNEEIEAVVAANPEIIPMRLALARRYFEAGEFDKALDHYFEVLNREQNPEALANVGWMTYLSGRPDIAVSYVEAAMDRQPDYLAAEWYLGNIYMALGRNDEASVFLVKISTSNEVPDDVKAEALKLLEQIRAEG
ncbi:hypothetical protein MNBD_ACTINO01-1860 [hydrothermal vent metagenome]|uniref:Tetratricopeptide repeat protein n=1 Tax=hydrothermal vent metagenome TaxID=652676 RepID=A0A3B0RCQ8_9ZZZZ